VGGPCGDGGLPDTVSAVSVPTFPGAVEPERVGTIESIGLQLSYLEWGDPDAPPVVMCHGMWDHARSFAVLAPLLAEHFRVIAIDARGHGDSNWADAYAWPCDVVDIVNVLRWVGRPVCLVGHSRGGGQATDAARALPELVRKVVNIDGFGPPPLSEQDLPTPARCVEFLDARRRASQRQRWRPYESLDQLVERRSAQNPRLSKRWLRYFVFHGARRDEDGWRWKSDPFMAHVFGPWRPEWIAPGYVTLKVPMLAIMGSEEDTWGPLPEEIVAARLATVPNLTRVTIEGAGHFVHMERPAETARAILDYLNE
jgi:pimeloyl-ACP methyl ester carboxylesterase